MDEPVRRLVLRLKEKPLVSAGIILIVALGVNLFVSVLLDRTLSREGVIARVLLFLLALFLAMRKDDWKTFSSDSRFIQWLRKR